MFDQIYPNFRFDRISQDCHQNFRELVYRSIAAQILRLTSVVVMLVALLLIFLLVAGCLTPHKVAAFRLTPRIAGSIRLSVTSPMGKKGEKTAGEYWDELKNKVAEKASRFSSDHSEAEVASQFSERRSKSAPTVGSALSTFKTYVAGDNIFFVHSVASVFGGFLLLFLPDVSSS